MFKQGGDLLFFHKVNSMTAILPSASLLLSLAQLKYSFQKTFLFSQVRKTSLSFERYKIIELFQREEKREDISVFSAYDVPLLPATANNSSG